MTDTEIFHFECVNRYNPAEYGHGREHIPIDPGDSLEVCASSLEAADRGMPDKVQGWLRGKNMTKGVQGLFPGVPYVQFIKRELNDSGYEGTPHNVHAKLKFWNQIKVDMRTDSQKLPLDLTVGDR